MAVAPADGALAAQEMIEVWRPGRPDGARRKRDHSKRSAHRRERPDRQPEAQAKAEIAASAETAAAGGASHPQAMPTEARPADEGRRERKERDGGRRSRRQHKRAETEAREEVAKAERRKAREEHSGRRRERRERDDIRSPRIWSSDERRSKEPDPNSPFAKLLALKERLETDGKEQR
jgi:ATP-dependent RNA helicase SUPV3L1/SUV3